MLYCIIKSYFYLYYALLLHTILSYIMLEFVIFSSIVSCFVFCYIWFIVGCIRRCIICCMEAFRYSHNSPESFRPHLSAPPANAELTTPSKPDLSLELRVRD